MAKELYIIEHDPYYQRSCFDISKYPVEFWDVNETISELSYLTHGYFRYYGKFPSKIGKLIVDDIYSKGAIDPAHDFVLDNYAGSGTTLVEAKLQGFDSYGIDINPFAVLACRVKTRNYNVQKLNDYWEELREEIISCNQSFYPENAQISFLIDEDSNSIEAISQEIERFKSDHNDAEKWFSEDAIKGLAIIKTLLLSRQHDSVREFFDLAFFSIVRRVSFAYDGEVRPHINKKKRARNVAEAYIKKVDEMIAAMTDWNKATSSNVQTNAIICNNADAQNVTTFLQNIRNETRKQLGLVVSHPPYLNCFDYIPVYKLKFMWGDGFQEVFGKYTFDDIKKMELKAHPADSYNNVANYFDHNRRVYQVIFDNLKSGGYCCIVIGDCTIREKLFEVHKTFISILEEIGFVTEKISYRSTMYGTGQYAYRHRADYSEDVDRKKDGVLFFRKP